MAESKLTTDTERCVTPGLCTCRPALPRCPRCGYTAHDASNLMDHYLCDGEIPLRRPTATGRL